MCHAACAGTRSCFLFSCAHTLLLLLRSLYARKYKDILKCLAGGEAGDPEAVPVLPFLTLAVLAEVGFGIVGEDYAVDTGH